MLAISSLIGDNLTVVGILPLAGLFALIILIVLAKAATKGTYDD
jgi:hypothetical protein